MLLDGGARADARDSLLRETALHKAVRSNAIDNVAALLAWVGRRRNPSDLVRVADIQGNTALHKAAAIASTDLAVWNLLLPADIALEALKKTNVDGLTVLQVAQKAQNSVAQTVLRAYDAHVSGY